MDRIVLAYGGSFDAAEAIAALHSEYREVIAVTMDLGQGQALEELRDRALSGGAARAHVLDLRETFACNYVLPSLKADALDEAGVPPVAPLARAVVAEKLVEIAFMEQASAVAHGAGAFDEGVKRLDAAISVSGPALKIAHVASPHAADGGRRARVNLWGRTIRVDGGGPVLEHEFKLTRPRGAAPAQPALVEIRFERGAPVSVNGVSMPLVELITTLTHLAGDHGVGRLEARGTMVEAPAALVLHRAHQQLLARAGASVDRAVGRQYADMIAAGQWATPARAALDQVIEKRQEAVNGSIRARLFRGELHFVD